MLTKKFVACALVRFYFFTAAHFHLADRSLPAASTSHFLTAAMKFHVFLPTKFVSLVFNLFLCYLRKCRHETEVNNVGKDSTLLMFFFSLKVRVAVRFPAKKRRVVSGLPYLLSELFYIGIPVVRTDGPANGHVTTKIT